MRGVTLASAGGQMSKSEAAGTMIKAVSGNMGRITAVTGLSFLLTSTAYLAWTYHMMELVKAPVSDAVTLVAAYLLQAAGIGLFSLFMRRREELIRTSLYAVLALHMLLLVPAAAGSSLIPGLVSGLAMNVCCGWIAGYYLQRLTFEAGASDRAKTLGTGYAAAIVTTWMLSVIGRGIFRHPAGSMGICLFLTVITFLTVRSMPLLSERDAGEKNAALKLQIPAGMSWKHFLILAGLPVLLFSIVNSSGFGFPSGDLSRGINLEFSRLFYAGGLVIAGFVNDRNRRYGAVCAVAALVIPFLMLAIRGESVSLLILWALSYFTFGFYTVYRIVLFSDIAMKKKRLWLAGAGLMIGRAGDALGETLCLALSERYLVLAGATALLFMISLLLAFRVFYILYMPETVRPRSEREIFQHFSARHDLSVREREVLRYLLEEKTNQEIAEELSISEGTVKYHIHNLLQKTSCRNRLDLLSVYAAEHDT